MREVETMAFGGRNVDFSVDHKASPQATLIAANKTLKKFGLEFVSHETFSDVCAFSIKLLKVK